MNRDKITPLKKKATGYQSQAITFSNVFNMVEAWRANKKARNDKIPSEIWDGVFIVLETIDESRVLPALGITKDQLSNERQARHLLAKARIEQSKPDENHDNAPLLELCEAKPTFPLESKPAKAFATNTCIVELYRADGMLMKIHLCTDKFEDLLQAFFSGSTTC